MPKSLEHYQAKSADWFKKRCLKAIKGRWDGIQTFKSQVHANQKEISLRFDNLGNLLQKFLKVSKPESL